MKKHLSIVLLILFIAVQGVRAQSLAAEKPYLKEVIDQLLLVWPKNRTVNLVFHGHSVPTGYGGFHEVHTLDAYPYQLLEQLKVVYPYAPINVITTSIGGEDAVSGAARFDRDVLPHRPDVVFIDYSLNDLTEDMGKVRAAWEKMIKSAQSHNIKVILVTPSPNQSIDICTPGNILEKHANQVRKLSKTYHTGLVDAFSLFKEKACQNGDLKKYMASLNHPNRAGHDLIATAALRWFLLTRDTTLAVTPPMGWNSWNTFQCNINEQLVKETADRMVASGMRDAGYKYLVLDDCWLAKTRDKDSNLVADPVKFPNGMKALIDYVHSKGLKFGLYNCVGTKTCAFYPGTKGHEYQDAKYYADLGIDYLKFDWCSSKGMNGRLSYITMANALRSTGRPIVFSICEWGTNQPWLWGNGVGELWRTTTDIINKFEGPPNARNNDNSVTYIADKQQGLRAYAGPGHWNDPDMLEVGRGMTVEEDRAHLSLWAIMAAPLIAGNDITKMTEATRAILTNKDIIAIDQDGLGVQGFRSGTRDSIETWHKPLTQGRWAVCLLNRSKQVKNININWADLSVTDPLTNRQLDLKNNYNYHSIWTKQKGSTRVPLKATLPAHDVLVFVLSTKSNL